jgi:hypothetical protein
MRQIKASAPPPIPREDRGIVSVTAALAVLEKVAEAAVEEAVVEEAAVEEAVVEEAVVEEAAVEEAAVEEAVVEEAVVEEVAVEEAVVEEAVVEEVVVEEVEELKGETPLEDLSRSQMVDLCKVLGIPSYGTKLEILTRLRAHSR